MSSTPTPSRLAASRAPARELINASTRAPAPGIAYQPGIDGLRALCVLAVVLYHADLAAFGGGFLGVEVFFVISGYLITALLRAEYQSVGRIDLGGFWLRRARRLLPALWALLFVVALVALCCLPSELYRLRGDLLAGLTYVSNWYLIFGEHSYFEQVGRPSLLRHLWSLAIEEQFYLVWPLLFVGLARRVSFRALGAVCVLLAAVSGLWLALRYVPNEDPSALYYDSGARAAAMLLGACLACWWTPAGATSDVARPPSSTGIDMLGAVGLLGLTLACTLFSEVDALVFRGGLLLVDGCALLAIFALVHPNGRWFRAALSLAPLRWLGTRSYGLYLWHWPLFALTRPGLDLPYEGAGIIVARIAAALLLAELSFRFVEQPVRQGALTARLRAWFASGAAQPPQRALTWLVAGTSALCLSLLARSFVQATPPVEPSFELELARSGRQGLALTGNAPPQPGSALAGRAQGNAPVASVLTPAPAASVPSVMIFGDSVALGAKNYLLEGHEGQVEIDSEVGRTSSTAMPHLRKLKRSHKLRPVMILHLGNNGSVFEEQIHEMMQLFAGDVQRVVVVNAHVPKRWQDRNNAVIASTFGKYPEVVLVDWLKASEGHRDWFGSDGLHLTHAGARAFAALLTPYYALPTAR